MTERTAAPRTPVASNRSKASRRITARRRISFSLTMIRFGAKTPASGVRRQPLLQLHSGARRIRRRPSQSLIGFQQRRSTVSPRAALATPTIAVAA